MRSLISLIVISLLLTSCKNPLNKSIVDPLTVEELRSISQKDTSFIEFYGEIQEFRQSFFAEEINQVKYGDISYMQLQKYFAYNEDTIFLNPIIEIAKAEWKVKYDHYKQKVDSLVDYWHNYLNENSLDSYAKIEFDHIDKSRYSHSNEIKDVKLAFKLTPLKGKIQQIRFSYKIRSKLQSEETESIYSSIFDDNRGSCILTTPFSKSVVRYWEVNSTLEKTLKHMSSAEFKRDYDITFEITKIRYNNKNIAEDDLIIPEVMEDYLRYPIVYEDDVIKYFFDTDYISEWEYIATAIDNELKKKDEKCYNLINAVVEFEED